MPGTVITFYSYKGGVGRSFALANVACQLGYWGYRVLCVDWDLDAPGLSFYFRDWVSKDGTGLVDMMSAFAAGGTPDYRKNRQSVTSYPNGGRVDLLPAGAQGRAYPTMAQSIDWARLYDTKGLGAYLEKMRADWIEEYDFVLVDSRTGITDIGGICTAQLPDILIMLFTANEQSLAGTLDVAQRAQEARDRLPYDRSPVLIMPVPSRVDSREEYRNAQEWRERFSTDLAQLFGPWLSREANVAKVLGHITIPYVGYWSFGEELAVLHEAEPTPDQISYSLHSLSALIAHRLGRTDLFARSRDAYVSSAATAAKASRFRYDFFLSHDQADSGLASHLAERLETLGFRVFSDKRRLPSRVQDAPAELENSHHLVILLGSNPSSRQLELAEWFFRRSLDDRSDRLVVPVLLGIDRISTEVPSWLRRTQAIRMNSVSGTANEIAEIVNEHATPS